MTMLGQWAEEAFTAGTALQVVLADEEGLVLEGLGEVFPPEALIAGLLGAEGAVTRIRRLLNVGPVSELIMRLTVDRMSICGRFFENAEGNYLLAVVVPSGSGASMLAHRIIDDFNASRRERS